MPPPLALLLTIAFIIPIFRRDIKQQRGVTGALWIPLLWLTIICSRYVSQWLNTFGYHFGAVNATDGSPIDAVVFGVLEIAGLRILVRRRVQLFEVIRNNRWIAIFLAYCLLSILWSDLPFVALKRWLKAIGHPIMVLVLLTEPDPEEAMICLLKRCGYLLIPTSVLFVKYYPQWGRGFDEWGFAQNIGVAMDKNALGYLCVIFGSAFFLQWLKTLKTQRSPARRTELAVCAVFIGMILWLLSGANAKTALVSFLVSILIMFLLGMKWVKKEYIGWYLVAVTLSFVTLDALFGVYTDVVEMLGRDPTLTDRTKVWADILKISDSPILGTGFESFWQGDRLKMLWSDWWWHPTQAHNGYIETYINLGWVGIVLFLGMLVDTFLKIRRELLKNLDWGRFRFCLFISILVFNYTDATFVALNSLWFMFYLIGMDYPQPRLAGAEQLPQADHPEPEMATVHA